VLVDGKGIVKIKPSGVGVATLPGIDLADYKELYYAKRSRASSTEKWVGANIVLKDDNGNSYKLQITSQFGNFNIKCTSKDSDLANTPAIQSKPPLLISGFVGLSPTEERVFPVALIDRLRTGHV